MNDERALVQLFHEVLDRQDFSGPFQRLQLELEKPGAAARRRGRRIFMTRNRMVLLAAALVLILGVGVFVSARALNGTNHTHSSIPASDGTAVAGLLARPLQFHKGTPCQPDGPFTDFLLGAGPVFDVPSSGVHTPWGYYSREFLLTPPDLLGPVVVRPLNLKSGKPLLFVSPYGAGPVYGTDTVDGKSVNQYAALSLDTDHPPDTRYEFRGTSYVQWPFQVGWPSTESGFCVGIQVDGPAFTEVYYDHVP